VVVDPLAAAAETAALSAPTRDMYLRAVVGCTRKVMNESNKFIP
jgi:hypothetical protein